MTHLRARIDSILLPVVAALGLFLFVPSLLFDQVWYRLDSVQVEDVHVGEDASIVIAGNVLQNYWGSYSVTIRRINDNGEPDWLVCQGYPDAPFEYRKGDYGVIKSKTLGWWLGGQDRLDNCWREGLNQPGLYMANTCHFALWPGNFKYARRCVLSNPFSVLPPT